MEYVVAFVVLLGVVVLMASGVLMGRSRIRGSCGGVGGGGDEGVCGVCGKERSKEGVRRGKGEGAV